MNLASTGRTTLFSHSRQWAATNTPATVPQTSANGHEREKVQRRLVPRAANEHESSSPLMNRSLCGILPPTLFEGKAGKSSQKQQDVMARGACSWATRRWPGGQQQSWRRSCQANRALSVRLDLLSARPVAGNSDKPLMGVFQPGGLRRVPQWPLQASSE